MSDKESLEITKLEGSNNYTQWKFELQIALEGKDLFGYVDETEVKPEATKTAELKAYNRCISRAKTIILCSINQKLRCNLINCSSAKEMLEVRKFEVQIALEGKDLFGYVDETKVKPEATKTAELNAYNRCISREKTIILCSINQKLRCNLINCSSAKEMWEKLSELYGDTSADAIQAAWKKFYAFHITEDESVRVQLERFESILKKLENVDKKPTDEAIVSKLLTSLPEKFELFSIAWECTPKADRTQKTLIARLIKEDNRLGEKEATTLALRVKNTSLNDANSDSKKKRSKKDIEELKKKTRCGVCKEKDHWARECPQKNSEKSDKPVKSPNALVCDITTSYQCVSAEVAETILSQTLVPDGT
ncbi:hypothetical protein TSAR_011674 [Trichomalopsis sarcophagae]|uniref:Uncharacterized protein n=1 Tax=Trichomalopsis sarcophagae TaxID=543379 RepID=A0A232EE52_9HYME|nr:hypothetical protein TSAR_011674 [Trichomalopsis sarcophagae]